MYAKLASAIVHNLNIEQKCYLYVKEGKESSSECNDYLNVILARRSMM